MYFYGKAGISQDYNKAWDYYWKGHSMGHTGCIAAIGAMCYYGNGMEINLQHAKSYYRDAAEKGLKWAWKMAGLSAERQRHFDEARQIYLEGIEHGSWICACNLGLLYYAGRFGEQNMERCAEYYREAIENGETQGYACMGEVFYEMGEYDQALSLFREGDDEGNPDCSAWLGRLDIEHGSAGKGVQTLRNALDRGSSLAGLFLGDYYYGQKTTPLRSSTITRQPTATWARPCSSSAACTSTVRAPRRNTPPPAFSSKGHGSSARTRPKPPSASSSTIDTDCGRHPPVPPPSRLSLCSHQPVPNRSG